MHEVGGCCCGVSGPGSSLGSTAVGPCTVCLASLGLCLLSHRMEELWSDRLASDWPTVGAHEMLAPQLLHSADEVPGWAWESQG